MGKSINPLCSPVFSPQMVGGDDPPGFVTENVSVRHCVRWVADSVAEEGAVARPPFKVVTAVVVATTGPVMENVSKSRRSWKRKQKTILILSILFLLD